MFSQNLYPVAYIFWNKSTSYVVMVTMMNIKATFLILLLMAVKGNTTTTTVPGSSSVASFDASSTTAAMQPISTNKTELTETTEKTTASSVDQTTLNGISTTMSTTSHNTSVWFGSGSTESDITDPTTQETDRTTTNITSTEIQTTPTATETTTKLTTRIQSTTVFLSTTPPVTESTITHTSPQSSTTSKVATIPSSTASPSDMHPAVLPICLTFFAIVLIIFIVVLYFYCTGKKIPCFGKKEKPGDAIVSLEPTNNQKFQWDNMIISKDDFEVQFKRKAGDDGRGFREEFRAIQTENSALSAAKDPTNVPKNRYDNVLPWDSTRVVLSNPPGESGNDYINANFVPGYLQKKKFIACQGPKDNTVADFWRMLWDQNCSTIVMVTNLVEAKKLKCHKYWPSENESEKYGDFTVTALDVKIRNFYTIRFFSLKMYDDPPRNIQQLHYTAWPDFGVPKNPHELLLFRRRVIAANPPHSGPIVVHCSAGVGRTGTYILIDATIEQLQAEGKADLFSFLTNMRKSRMMLVQTDAQYMFSHEAVLEHIKYGNTEVSIKDLRSQVKSLRETVENSEDNLLEQQFSSLVKVKMNKEMMKHGRQSIKKNRVLQIIPYDRNRVTLPLKPGQEKSDYINASFIDGFRQKNEYIATQGPLAETAADFWSMTWMHGSQSIVMLTGLVEKGHEMCFRYWPDEKDAESTFGDITVKYAGKDDDDIVDYAVREFIITNKMAPGEGERKIRQFHYNGWPEVGLPSDAHGMIEISGRLASKNKSDQFSPTIVHCSSGGGRTGVFIALNILMDQAANEGLVDVFQTVKYLRAQRPHIIQTQEQLYFCFVALLQYLETNQMVTNFIENPNSSVGENSHSIAPLNEGGNATQLLSVKTTTPQGSMNNKLDLNSLADSVKVGEKVPSVTSKESSNTEGSTYKNDDMSLSDENEDDKNSKSQSSVSDFEIVNETKDNVVNV